MKPNRRTSQKKHATSNFGIPKRSNPCTCNTFLCDPHPGGWCRHCGQLIDQNGVNRVQSTSR